VTPDLRGPELLPLEVLIQPLLGDLADVDNIALVRRRYEIEIRKA
jgi:hypothetical protein